MSNTYRRKNDTWNFSANDYSWEDGFLRIIPMNTNSKEFMKKKSHFHSDSYIGSGVPHWYVNMFHERTNRRNSKKEIQKWIKNPEDYEVLLKPHIKDAGWNYW